MPECYCAKVDNGSVAQVIVCNDCDWAANHFGGLWVCVGEMLPGIGWAVVNGEVVKPAPPTEGES